MVQSRTEKRRNITNTQSVFFCRNSLILITLGIAYLSEKNEHY